MRILVSLVPWLAGGAVIVVWMMQAAHPVPVHGLALALWLLAGMPVAHALRRTAAGVLRWDGQHWTWEAGTSVLVGRAIRRLDWQGALLLEFRPVDGRSLWLWPERRMDHRLWDDLRRALQVPLTEAADAAGGEVRS